MRPGAPPASVAGGRREPRAMTKVLLIDDEQPLLDALVDYLQADGIDVLATTRLIEAEYALTTTEFDVVLADVHLSHSFGREGLALLKYVREVSPRTRVILMTAYTSTALGQEAHAAGAALYLTKPFRVQDLLQYLRALPPREDV